MRALATTILLGACVSTGSLSTALDGARRDLGELPTDPAMRCAPRDLALATAHVEFATIEARQGRPSRVASHVAAAEAALARARALVGPCLPSPEPEPGGAAPCEVPADYRGARDPDGCPIAPPDSDRDGDGVPDRRDFCPDNPEDLDGWEDEDGCPDPDNDGDGVPDVDDACPREPGPPEARGCPVVDRDGDGVADDVDRCPDAPETLNDYLDDDGCPDVAPRAIRVGPSGIDLLMPITFADATLTGGFDALDELVALLRDAPELRLALHVHTEALDTPELALNLSKGRARALQSYLVERGADPTRIEAIGFGSERPVDTNRTSAGRERNRRVEVVLAR